MMFFGWRLRAPWSALVLAAMLGGGSEAARAQIRVDGSADAVRIDVVNARLRDVLDALQARFALHYRSRSTLDTERTVKLVAPLHQSIVRLLEGYDFVIADTPR